MLQIHGPSDCLTAAKVHTHMNGDFAVLEFGPVRFYIDDPEQCDWLIKAAVEAKQLLDPPPVAPAPSGAQGTAEMAASVTA